MKNASLIVLLVLSVFSPLMLWAEQTLNTDDTQEASKVIEADRMDKSEIEQDAKAEEPKLDQKDSIDRINDTLRMAINVSAIETAFPLSAGLSLIYQNNEKWLLEFNYSRNLFALNTLDLNADTLGQQNISIKAHYYVRENYYALIGLGKRFTKARLNEEYFNYSNYSYEDTFSKFNTDYVTVGAGSVFKLANNLQLNVDWVAFNFNFAKNNSQSSASLSENHQDDVLEDEKILNDYASHSLLRLSIMGQY